MPLAMTAFQVPPQHGRVVLITGANTGIGLITARELARAGAQVFIACRSEARGKEAQAAIAAATGKQVTLITLDLSDLSSVRAAAEAFLARGLPLHVLINNAGLAGQRGLTRQGFELTFGVNHLGHFLLTELLLPRIRASAPARIVTVASRAHMRAHTIPFAALREPTQSLTGVPEYGVSKLANVLFSAELSRRLQGSGVTTYALHPGVVATDVWRHVPAFARGLIKLFMISPEQGALTTLHCATSPEAERQSGLYYDEQRVKEPNAAARDPALARELWQQSETWIAGAATSIHTPVSRH
jgi:NAD(P)-dependent dehydrogenase (short-subunit alcohol dehydrogenase family)